MPELSRLQLAVYGALACVALLLGARWIRSSEASGDDPGGVAFAGGVSGAQAPDQGEQGFTPGDGDVVVHVAGAVEEPGVYRLPDGSRVTDAVERAGGANGAAAPDGINLAAELTDGQQVVVPARTPAGDVTAAAADSAATGPISLGTATVEDLDTIEGIGPVTASQIIEFRDQNGVGSIDDLDQISGIGPTTMEALRARLQP